MKPRRIAAWGASITFVVLLGLYSEFVRETTTFSPTFLLACADTEWPLPAWTCKQVLLHRDFTPSEIAELNAEAAAAFPVSVKDPALADEMLSLFIARGVDVNAVDEKSKGGWTALHVAASVGDVDGVKLLLKYGARPNAKNRQGETALEYARQWQQRYPAEPNRAVVVKLLENPQEQGATRR
jgi:ankyrin repeat protein